MFFNAGYNEQAFCHKPCFVINPVKVSHFCVFLENDTFSKTTEKHKNDSL